MWRRKEIFHNSPARQDPPISLYTSVAEAMRKNKLGRVRVKKEPTTDGLTKVTVTGWRRAALQRFNHITEQAGARMNNISSKRNFPDPELRQERAVQEVIAEAKKGRRQSSI